MEIFLEVLKIIGSVLFMFIAISLCIFIHELGHFLAARWRGMHVIAFSIGFKKAWSKKFKNFEFRIGWLPFGGYVDLPQIDMTTHEVKDENGNVLPHAKPLDKIITAFAGPFFNVLLGLLVGCLVWWFGMPKDTPQANRVEVGIIDRKGPEYQAGLRAGDKIVAINGKPFYCTWDQFVRKLIFSIGKVNYTVQRDGKKLDISFVPKPNPNAPAQMRREAIAYPFFKPLFPVTMYPDSGSPAEVAGMKDGDVVLEVNGKKIAGFMHFVTLENTLSKPMNILVERDGKKVLVENIKPEVYQKVWLVGFIFNPAKMPVKVDNVMPGKPAALAGLKPGDVILKIDGKAVVAAADMKKFVGQTEGREFIMTVKRGDKDLDLKMKAYAQTNYMIGVRLTYWAYPSPVKQFIDVIDMTYLSVRGMFYWGANKLKISENGSSIKPRNLSGPINLGQNLFLSVYRRSIMYGIYFMVVISFALAIFNLLPLPVLDGGYIALGLFEAAVRRPLPPSFIKPIFATFIVLLIGLMLYVTFYDIKRLTPAKEEAAADVYKPDYEYSQSVLNQMTPEERKALLAPKKTELKKAVEKIESDEKNVLLAPQKPTTPNR
jgi:regulator of sigma E protease